MVDEKLNILESKIDLLIGINRKLKEENHNLKEMLNDDGKNILNNKESLINSSSIGEKEKIIKEKVKNVLTKIEKLEPLI